MAEMIVKYSILPSNSELSFEKLEEIVKNKISEFNNSIVIENVEKVNVGFGLEGLSITIRLDENLGSEDLKEFIENDESIGEVRVDFMDRL